MNKNISLEVLQQIIKDNPSIQDTLNKLELSEEDVSNG